MRRGKQAALVTLLLRIGSQVIAFSAQPRLSLIAAAQTTHSITSLTMSTGGTNLVSAKRRRYLIARHGETNFNKEGREQGTLDSPRLTLDGISQAAGLGVYVARRQAGQSQEENSPPISRTWCSPLTRCRQTFAAVSGCCSSNRQHAPLPDPTIHADLREIELCEWQGRLTQEIIEQDAENWERFKTDPQSLRLDRGRFAPVLDMFERGRGCWKAIRADAVAGESKRDVVFIMCHGQLGQCLLLQALGMDVENYGKSAKYMFDNAGCVEVEWEDGDECATRWRRVHPVESGWQDRPTSQELASLWEPPPEKYNSS